MRLPAMKTVVLVGEASGYNGCEDDAVASLFLV